MNICYNMHIVFDCLYNICIELRSTTALPLEAQSGSLYCISVGCFSEGLQKLLTKPRLFLFILSLFACVFSLLSLLCVLLPPSRVHCFISYFYCVELFLYGCGRDCDEWGTCFSCNASKSHCIDLTMVQIVWICQKALSENSFIIVFESFVHSLLYAWSLLLPWFLWLWSLAAINALWQLVHFNCVCLCVCVRKLEHKHISLSHKPVYLQHYVYLYV